MHHYLLLQRRDWPQRFLRDRALPILQQLTPMLKSPFKHKSNHPFGQTTFNKFQINNREHSRLTGILCVKVWHTVLLEIDSDYNSKKSADFGHVNWVNYSSALSSEPHQHNHFDTKSVNSRADISRL